MHRHWNALTRSAAAVLLALPLALACRGPRHGMAQMSESEVAEHMEDIAEFGLDAVDASDQQIADVNHVLRGFAPEVVKLRAEHRALGAELRAELAKGSIDPERIDALRRRALDLFDRASAKGSQTLVSAARVLTPEQRSELTYKWEKYAN